MKMFSAILWCLLMLACSSANAAVLVFSADGTYVTKSSLFAAYSSADTRGNTVVVKGHEVVTTPIAWKSDRELKFEKGGYITFTGAGTLTGLKTATPDNFGVNTTPGTTDMSTALRSAATAADTVVIPIGTYKASLALTGAADAKKTIRGESREGSILVAKDTSTAVISIYPPAHFTTIENLTIKNPAGNNGTHYGIWSKGDGAGHGISYLTMHDITISGFNINIRLDEFNGHRMESVLTSGAVASGAAPSGANIYAGHHTNHCVGIVMRDIHSFGGKYGYYFENAEAPMLSQSESLNATENGLLATSSTGVTGMNITDSQFDSCGAGAVKLYKVSNGQFTNVWASCGVPGASSPVYGYPGGYGLWMEESDHNSFSNLETYGNATNGVYIATGSQKNSFNNVQSVMNGGDGIKVVSGAWGNTFSSPVVWNNSGKGINFLDTTVNEPNQITGLYSAGNKGGSNIFQSKDIMTGGTSLSGQTTALFFHKTAISDGTTKDTLSVAGTSNKEIVMPRAGAILGISVALTGAVTGGTVGFNSRINGSNQPDVIQLSVGTPQYNTGNQSYKTILFNAGDRIGALYGARSLTTSGGSGALVTIWVMLN